MVKSYLIDGKTVTTHLGHRSRMALGQHLSYFELDCDIKTKSQVLSLRVVGLCGSAHFVINYH